MPKINTVTADAALARFKGHSLKETVKDATEIGNIPNVGGIQALLCGLAFAAGRARRAAKINKADFTTEYDAFAASYYSWPGRKAPSTASRDQYVSKYGAFVEAGLAAWDATPVVAAAIDTADVTLSWRAGKVRELAKASKSPSPAEIRKAFAITESSGGNKGRTQGGRVKSLLASIEKLANDGAFRKALPTFGKVNHSAIIEIVQAALSMRTEIATTAKGDAAKKEAAKLKKLNASVAALPQPEGSRKASN